MYIVLRVTDDALILHDQQSMHLDNFRYTGTFMDMYDRRKCLLVAEAVSMENWDCVVSLRGKADLTIFTLPIVLAHSYARIYWSSISFEVEELRQR